MSWSTSELRVRLAPLNRFKPSSRIFYWPFQGGTSFVDLLCFCSVLCLLCLCARLFICALWSPAGKGLTSWLSFVVSAVSLSLPHWYPGSGVVLDCIDSWSLRHYLVLLVLLTCFLSLFYLFWIWECKHWTGFNIRPSKIYPPRWFKSRDLSKATPQHTYIWYIFSSVTWKLSSRFA